MDKKDLTKEQLQNKIKEQSVLLIIMLTVVGFCMLAYSCVALYTALRAVPSGNMDPMFSYGFSNMIEKVFSGMFNAAVLFLTAGLFRKMKDSGTPFMDVIIKRLYLISGLMISNAVLSPVLAIAVTVIMKGSVQHRVLFSGMSFGVVLSVVVLVLARIFRYGTMLQQESDETL